MALHDRTSEIGPADAATQSPVLASPSLHLARSETADVIIVGTGMGGGVTAGALAEHGVDVLQFERGAYRGTHPGNHERSDGQPGRGFGYDATPLADRMRDETVCIQSQGEAKRPVRPGIGGSSAFWGGLSLRMLHYEFADWPMVVRDQLLEQYYERAERRMNVRDARFPSDGAFRRIVQRSISTHHVALSPIAYGRYNGATEATSRRFCTADPLRDLQETVPSRHLPRRYRLLPEHEAVRVYVSADGRRVDGLEVQDGRGGQKRRARAAVYVLAAGAVQTPMILHRSDPARMGLAATSIGRGITDHPIVCQPIEIPYGSILYEYQPHARVVARPCDDLGGTHPYNVVVQIGNFDRSRGYRSSGSRYGEIVFLLNAGLVDGNGVDHGADGVPIVRIRRCAIGPRLWNEMNAMAGMVVAALGARPLGDMAVSPLMKVTHQVGSLRMATTGNGVVDEDLRVGGLENLYVCDGSILCSSPAANPGLTIAALAERLADHLL